MNATLQKLSAVPLPGLTLDTLGLYLASLGLLRILSRKWPSIRGCWRNGCFTVVGGPISSEQLEEFLYEVGLNEEWSDYGKPWDAFQKKDTKLARAKKPATNVALWRSREATENQAVLQQSHLAIGQRLFFNPLFGTGGNVGQRLFARGWQVAKEAVAKPSRKTKPEDIKSDLHALLNGEPCRCLSDYYNAGCWFSAANKIYNSGLKPYKEGQITPWAMLLACEAFPLLAGSPSRQLGVHRSAFGAFPFVTRAAAPLTEQSAGQTLGEFWAPVWNRPMSLAEVSALFQSGRAEIDGRAALTSVAFAGAIVQRGINAGLSEFRNFSLIRTTSDNTFESRLSSVVAVPKNDPASSVAVRRILKTRNKLPRDKKQGKNWRFRGLQGRIDRALIALAETAGEERKDLQVERSWQLIDEVFASLAKVDRNKAFREEGVRFELLPLDWLAWLLERTTHQRTEIRLAMSIASLRPETQTNKSQNADKAPQRFLAYRLGSIGKGRDWQIPKVPPLRRIWSPKSLVENLIALGKRRLFESSPKQAPPFQSEVNASVTDAGEVQDVVDESKDFQSEVNASVTDALHFLSQGIDDESLGKWIDRFSLFNWSDNRESKDLLRKWVSRVGKPDLSELNNSDSMIYGFFRPLFDSFALRRLQQSDPQVAGGHETNPNVKIGRLVPIVSALDRGDVMAAWEMASAAYRSERIALADFHPDLFSHKDPKRLLASILFPVNIRGLTKLFERWQSPSNPNRG